MHESPELLHVGERQERDAGIAGNLRGSRDGAAGEPERRRLAQALGGPADGPDLAEQADLAEEREVGRERVARPPTTSPRRRPRGRARARRR